MTTVTVELPKHIVVEALTTRRQQLKRAAAAASNKLVAELYEKDANEIDLGIASIKELIEQPAQSNRKPPGA